MSKAKINYEMLKFFRTQVDVNTSFISKKLDIEEEKYISWEKWKDYPSFCLK